LERYIALDIVGSYHQSIHSSLSRPPLAVWRDHEGEIPLRLPEDRLQFWVSFLPEQERTLRPTGIHLFDLRYWSPALSADVGPSPDAGLDAAWAGACFGIPALTALFAVQCHGGVQGRSVLVAGGAGAVGHYAVQFARLLGARQVLATVSSAEKAELVRNAGADAAIDYRREDVIQRVRALTADGVDRVIEVDIAANGALDAELLKSGGEAVVYGSGSREFSLPFLPLIVRNLTLHFFIVYHLGAADRAQAEATLTRLLQEGRLQHNIGARLPLAEIAAAHERVESGRLIGNVVLSID